ncbi:MAG: TolC family protein [Spirochaetes bacterium]|nr:MAG: TolC family protein [Spirochaetota bacterium]
MNTMRSGIPRTPGRSVTILLCGLVLCALGAAAAGAKDDDVKSLIIGASGVSDADADTARGKESLSLFDFYALAVKNTERLALEAEGAVQSQARRDQALGSFLPRLYLRGAYLFPQSESKMSSASTKSYVSLYARQPILTGLQELASYMAARSDVKLREMNVRYAASQLLLDVASGYYRVIRAEKSLATSREVLKLYRDMLGEINYRVALGRSRPSESLRINAQIFRLEADITALEDGLADTRLVLGTLTALGPDFRIAEIEVLPEPAYDPATERTVVASRYDVLAAIQQIEVAKAGVLQAEGGHLPSVYLEGNYLLYQRHHTGTNYYGGLGVELPLFLGGATSARVRESESAQRQAELRLSTVTRAAYEDVQGAYRAWMLSRREYEAYRKALDSAQDEYKTSNYEFQMKLVTLLDLLTSLASYQNAKDDYQQAALQFGFNRVRLGVAVNEFAGGGVAVLRNAASPRATEK